MSTLRHRLCERIASGALRMRARGVFAENVGNSKKDAVGAIWAQLYAILDDGSQKVRDLSFCVFSHRQFKNGGTAMKMFLAMSLMLFAGMESSAWETRPGRPALPSQKRRPLMWLYLRRWLLRDLTSFHKKEATL